MLYLPTAPPLPSQFPNLRDSTTAQENQLAPSHSHALLRLPPLPGCELRPCWRDGVHGPRALLPGGEPGAPPWCPASARRGPRPPAQPHPSARSGGSGDGRRGDFDCGGRRRGVPAAGGGHRRCHGADGRARLGAVPARDLLLRTAPARRRGPPDSRAGEPPRRGGVRSAAAGALRRRGPRRRRRLPRVPMLDLLHRWAISGRRGELKAGCRSYSRGMNGRD